MSLVFCDRATDAVGIACAILSAGAPHRRHALSHAFIRTCPVSGKADVAALCLWQGKIVEIAAQYTGKCTRRILRDCGAKRSLTADEAREYGLRTTRRGDPDGPGVAEPWEDSPVLIKVTS
jgi:ATP-dependent protease ClpP protease subunit